MPRLAMKDNLKPSSGVTSDLAAGNLTVVGDADLVRHIFIGKLLLGLADERDLRDCIDSIRVVARIGYQAVIPEGAGNGIPALLHPNRGQAGKANHVPHCEDGRYLGAK